MSKTLKGGLAWALPVQPDELLDRIDTYTTVLPTIRALRLCNRFGQGPQAHITKLPVEIVSAIEAIVFKKQLRQYNFEHMTWEVEFSCFESTCAPKDHFKGSGLDIGNLADEYMMDFEECKSCNKAGYGPYDGKCQKRCMNKTPQNKRCFGCKNKIGTDECERICPNAYEQAVNEGCQEFGNGTHEQHEENQSSWPSRIFGFGKFAKVLKEEFGLEVQFINTVKATKGPWPAHKNHRWQTSSGRQTILCYLTLPKYSGPSHHYDVQPTGDFIDDMSDMGRDEGIVTVDAAQAVEVDTTSLTITDKQRRRFQRVLKKLGLQLYVHGSQVYGTKVSPNADMKVSTLTAQKGAGFTKNNDVANADWPRLLLLFESS
ncbi:hypothetical protein LTR22_011718 [Elasticomyces elasticus]|nr:hypothetical protein LTR22_011718 [Elasticomyces elasticus]KAK4919022.1 hypothetical protein LTR49_013339 [Elasticomyces elasticus]KAK5756629.1 hypothetical protein LTS12_013219 [Elasticomyces elasticus]